MRRLARILGTLMIVGGLGTLGWAVLVWQWEDPFTSVYTTYQQHKLESEYDRRVAAYRVPEQPPPATAPVARRRDEKARERELRRAVVRQRRAIERHARRYRVSLTEGQPIGRLRVPRLGVNMIAVNGTRTDTLEKGPARYSGPLPSYVPGEGELIYVAGHRTTYGAPFSRIERLRRGDRATLELPYGTFEYRVFRHVIVDDEDFSVLRSHGREVLALQACHPRFFATQRYIVYAKLVRVTPASGPAYTVAGDRVAPA